MSVHPVLKIDVDDSAFAKFYSLFENYSAELDAMPESWRTLNEAMGGAGKALSEGALTAKESLAVAAAQAGIISEALRDAVKEQNNLGSATQNTGKRMQGLAQGARDVGKAISFVGGWIVRLGALGGLGGLLSGLGIADLASSAVRQYRQAGGLGLTTGQLQSFQVNAYPFLDVNALAGAVNAQADITKAGAFAALGMDPLAAMRANPLTLPFDELIRARELYLKAKQGTQKQVPGLSDATLGALGLTFDEVRYAAKQPLSQILLQRQQTLADSSQLGFGRYSAEQMREFTRELQKAGFYIEDSFIVALAPLAPQLGRLADDVAKVIAAFLKSGGFEAVISGATSALKNMLNFLKNVDWKKFGAEIGVIIDKLGFLVPKDVRVPKPYQNSEDNPYSKSGEDYQIRKGFEWVRNVGRSIVGNVLNGGDFVKNNPLDEKVYRNGKLVWGQYPTTAAGILANARLLSSYPQNWHADTISKIITRWAPPSDHNPTGQYIASVAKWSGVGANVPMSKWTEDQFARVFAAMSRFEGTDEVTASQVKAVLDSAHMVDMISNVDAKVHKYGRNWMRYLPKDVASFVSSAHLSASEKTSTSVAVINKALRRALTQHNARTTKVAIKVHNPTQARVTAQVNAVSTAQ